MFDIINGTIDEGKIKRFDDELIKKLGYKDHKKGQEKALHATGVEVRITKENCKLNLSFTSDNDGKIIFYIGQYAIKEESVKKGVNDFNIELHERFINYNPKPKSIYPNNMFRIIFGKGYQVSNFKIDETNSLPSSLNIPKIVAYGSSFTEGVGAFSYQNAYISILKDILQVDILNKALSGSCLCEKEMANYLASIDTDYYLLELGMNMRGMMDNDEFEDRVDYLLSTLAKTKRKIFIISSVDFFKEKFSIYKEIDPYFERNISYSNTLNKLAKKYNIILFKLSNLIYDYCDISADMLHPSPIGHIKIGTLLATHLKKILA